MKKFMYAVLASLIAGMILEKFTPYKIVTFAVDKFILFFAFLTNKINIPMYFLVAFIIIAAIVIVKSIILLIKPKFHRYKSDKIFGIKWEWSYDSFSRQLNPSSFDSVDPFCPKCDMRLIYLNDSDWDGIDNIAVHCEKCDLHKTFEGKDIYDLEASVKNEIERRVRSGEYKKALEAK